MREQFYDFDIYDIPEPFDSKLELSSEQNLLVLSRVQDLNQHKDLLIKILSAIDYTDQENAMIAGLDSEVSINISKTVSDKITHVICFGLMPKDVGFNASFRPNTFYKTEKFSVLLSYNLEKLGTSVDNKKALWAALQMEFKK